MLKRLKKISIGGLIVIFLCTDLIGTLAPQAANAQIPVSIVVDAPNTVDKITDMIVSVLKAALLNAGVRAASYALRKIAYDSAVWIASGGKGQGPQAFPLTSGSYLRDVANEAGGSAVEELGKEFGLNLCKIPDVKIDLALRIGLRTKFSGAPPKPACDFTTFTKTWRDGFSKFKDNPGAVTKVFNTSLKADDSDLGLYFQSYEKIGDIVMNQKYTKTMDRQEGQGYKASTNLVADDKIKTPAANIKETANGNGPTDKVVQSNEDQLNAALASGDIKVFPTVLSIFASTLAGQMINNFRTKGMLPFGINYKGEGSNSSDANTDSALNSYDSGGTTPGRQAAQNFFSYLTVIDFKEQDNYDLLSQLSSCPESPSNYNCRAGDDLVNAANQELTIGQAIKLKVLDGNRPLIPPDDPKRNDQNCYKSGYCLNNVRVLRQARVLPLGFEVAVKNAKPDWTLAKVVAGFNDCTKNASGQIMTDMGNKPYCHLIDPNWVIKVPAARCKANVNGQQLLASGAPNRMQECADLQTCIATDAHGTCTNYAYCTREKNTWKFAAEACEPQFATCHSFQNDKGQTVSYLERTLDKSSCNVGNSGCSAYSLTQDASGKWLPPAIDGVTYSNTSVFLNSKVDTCSANAVGCTALNVASSTEGDTLYIKKAPDYLKCYDANPATAKVDWPTTTAALAKITAASASCSQYSKVCIPDETSCNWYDPVSGGGARIPGRFKPADIVNGIPNDECNEKCVGYDTYREMPSNYSNGQAMAYIIPSSGKTCSAMDEGCTGFTNLSTATGGVENIEYYSYLRPCATPSEAPNGQGKTFFTYEGSKESGFQLKTYSLMPESSGTTGPIGSPKYFYKDDTERVALMNTCTDVLYKSGAASPDCRQFNDQAGNVYYRFLSKVIPVTEVCTAFRINDAQFYTTSDASGACTANKGFWDSSVNQCKMCLQNGSYINGSCIYEGIPMGVDNNAGVSQSCSAEYNSCHAYKGNAGNNIETIFTENFESGATNWSNGTVAVVSTHVGEHSYEDDTVAPATRVVTLEPGKSYDLTFWAQGNGGNISVSLDNGVVVPFGTVSIGPTWRQYHLGPVDLAGTASTTRLMFTHSQAGAMFIDNVRLMRVVDMLYLVKDTLKVDPVCDSNLNDNLPGEALGCKAYTDPRKKPYYLTGFSNLCREDAIGCVALTDTKNSASAGPEAYNVWVFGSEGYETNPFIIGTDTIHPVSCKVDLGQKGCFTNITGHTAAEISAAFAAQSASGQSATSWFVTSTIYIKPDDPKVDPPVYLVADKSATCSQSDLGCTYAGLLSVDITGTHFVTTTVKNDPGQYNDDKNDILCTNEAVGCNTYSDGTSFKDPLKSGQQMCVYKTDVPYNNSTASGWFWKQPVGTCSNNVSQKCYSKTDCGTGTNITCDNISIQPCYPGYPMIDPYRLVDGEYGLWSFGNASSSNFAGECPADQNLCTQFDDYADLDSRGLPRSYFMKNDDKLKLGDCNGQVSQKNGCVLFDEVSNPLKYWNTAASYLASDAIDGQAVQPVNSNTSGSTSNDANAIIKVVQDRVCGEWLECGSSHTTFDQREGKYKIICDGDLRRCAPQNGSGTCKTQKSSYQGKTLTEDFYISRSSTWSNMDYDGYSLLDTFPVEELKQVDVGNGDYRLVKKIPCAGVNCASGVTSPSCATDDQRCGENSNGFCLNKTCVINKNNSTGNSPTELKDGAPPHICRGYPETGSPFPRRSKGSQSFESAHICDENVSNADCECDYSVVNYGDAITKYWNYNKTKIVDSSGVLRPLASIDGVCTDDATVQCTADSDCGAGYCSFIKAPAGICLGGPKDGQACSVNTTDLNDENGCKGGSCQFKKSEKSALGWKGFCLEQDMSRALNGSGNEHPCLLWYPVDLLSGVVDMNQQHTDAGYMPASSGGTNYCTNASGGNDKQVTFNIGFGACGLDTACGDDVHYDGQYYYNGLKPPSSGYFGYDYGYGFPELRYDEDSGSMGSGTGNWSYGVFSRVRINVDDATYGFSPRVALSSLPSHYSPYWAGRNVGAYAIPNAVSGINTQLNNIRLEDVDAIDILVSNSTGMYVSGGTSNIPPGDRFYLVPPDSRSLWDSTYQTQYILDSAGNPVVQAGFFKKRKNELALFYANKPDWLSGDGGTMSYNFDGKIPGISGQLWDAQNQSGYTPSTLWAPSFTANGEFAGDNNLKVRGFCSEENQTKGSFGAWHGFKLNFDPNSHKFTSIDTAYCDQNQDDGASKKRMQTHKYVVYQVTLHLREWCDNVGTAPFVANGNSAVAWTDRLWRVDPTWTAAASRYSVPTLGYTYATATAPFGSLPSFAPSDYKSSLIASFKSAGWVPGLPPGTKSDGFATKLNTPDPLNSAFPYSCTGNTICSGNTGRNGDVYNFVSVPQASSHDAVWGSNLLNTIFARFWNNTYNATNGQYSGNVPYDLTAKGDSSYTPKAPEVHPLGACMNTLDNNGTVNCVENYGVSGFSVNKVYSKGDVVADGNTAEINFFMEAGKNQMPIRQVSVDWGDGQSTNGSDAQVYSGYFRNNIGLTTLNPATSECVMESKAPDFAHIKDKTCDLSFFSATKNYSCDVNSPNFKTGSVCGPYTSGCCVFTPRIQIRDNWDWCSGSCGANGCHGTDCDLSNGNMPHWLYFPGSSPGTHGTIIVGAQ